MKIKSTGSFFLYVLSYCCVPATYVLGAQTVVYAEQVTDTTSYKSASNILEQLDDGSGGNRLQWKHYNIDYVCESGPSYSGNDLILDKYLYSEDCVEGKYFNVFRLLLNGFIREIKDLNYYKELSISYHLQKGKILLEDLKSDVEEAIRILKFVEEKYPINKFAYPSTFPEGAGNVSNEGLEESVCFPISSAARNYAKQILDLYHKRLKMYTRQMSLFYNYLTWKVADLMIIPEWNTVPDYKCPSGLKNSTSATHTEFIMVYKILQEVSHRRGSLLNMNSISDFDWALNALSGKLPRKIYSAKAMCPVCEAFLTSLYNVCGCDGVFISKWNDYGSPSGPKGALKKVYLKGIKGGTYVDLATPDNRKKSTPSRIAKKNLSTRRA